MQSDEGLEERLHGGVIGEVRWEGGSFDEDGGCGCAEAATARRSREIDE